MLSMEGKWLVISLEVEGIINYYSQTLPLLKGVANKMEKLRRDFIWGSLEEK